MKAILSDIHGNLEALEAVLQDISAFPQKVEAIYCLGDIVGYGPNPRECVERAMKFDLVLMGNHDHAVLFEPRDFNPIAEASAWWSRQQLDQAIPSREQAEKRWEFLGELAYGHAEEGFFFVHASPRQPLSEYIFPSDIYNKAKMDRIFSLIGRCCFHGHTHIPGIFTEDGQFRTPAEIDHTYVLDGRKTLCNVGSVGQPRDGDWHACYVLFDGETIRFRRVEYDVASTVKKIHGIAELNRFLGDRLLLGH